MMQSRRASYPTNEILFLWGDDFRFGNPDAMFPNMDRLLAYIARNEQVPSEPASNRAHSTNCC